MGNVSSKSDEEIKWRVSRTCVLNGACVAVACRGDAVLFGNTMLANNYAREFTVAEWQAFLAGVKLGDFDDIA